MGLVGFLSGELESRTEDREERLTLLSVQLSRIFGVFLFALRLWVEVLVC